MKDHVPAYLQHQYSLHPRGKAKNLTNSCNFAEKVVSIDASGNCFLCRCEAWLPISVGNINQFQRLDDIWQSPVAKTLAEDLQEKKYSYCSVDICGIKQQNQYQEDFYLNVSIDESCNLRCPSCRKGLINITSGPRFDEKLTTSKNLSRLISNFDRQTFITMSGNGDPFASLIYRPILLNTIPNPKHKYRILTNGLLLKKILPKTSIQESIVEYNISIDAGDKDTYEKVRLGGRWEHLLENLYWLKQNTKASISLNFVLQNKNFQSIPHFERLIDHLEVAGHVTKLEDWSTFANFKEENVLQKSHKNFEECIEICRKITSPNLKWQPELSQMIKSS